jgi:hypothetical protein
MCGLIGDDVGIARDGTADLLDDTGLSVAQQGGGLGVALGAQNGGFAL